MIPKMKKPSLDAIRKFKEQQEQKKREQEERKVQEKLYTLEHRAAQGDKKAKSQLKQIEKVQDDKKRHDVARQSCPAPSAQPSTNQTKKAAPSVPRKPRVAETDFEELMRLAKNNTNQVKIPEKTSRQEQSQLSAKKVTIGAEDKRGKPELPPTRSDPRAVSDDKRRRPVIEAQSGHDRAAPRPSASDIYHRVQVVHNRPTVQHRPPTQRRPPQPLPQMRRSYHRDEDDFEDEDEYESDGFVVNEGDDEVQDELQQTLKNVFRYDKRRCDLREQEIDRQYRAIGKVSTFEDLEREERRASRLAASEDARAQREEDERRALKKMRRKGKM